MRVLASLFAALLLSGCVGVLDNCPDGLRDPPWGSGVPDPHKGP
jgi:hypothetical protein